MESTTKREDPKQGERPPDRRNPAPPRFAAEAMRSGVNVKVSVLEEWQDEEEKEHGYGHGV